MSEDSDGYSIAAPILASNRQGGKDADTPCLSDLSERDKPWDKHRVNCDTTANYYKGSEFDKYAERMNECSGLFKAGANAKSEACLDEPVERTTL